MSFSTFTPTVLTIPSTGTTGSGTGEINVVTNPTASTDTLLWAATGLTASRDATGSPLDPVVPTGFSLSATATGQTFVSAALTVPTSLRNRKLKLEFAMSASTAGFKVDVLKSDGTTRFSLTTDVSSVSNLPSLTGKYVTYFDMDAGSTVKVRFTSTAGSVGVPVVVKFTQVIVGPGIQPQGAVVGEWVSFTPTGSWTTNTAYLGKWRRVGDSMELQYDISCSGLPTAGILSLDLPSGYSLDQTKFTQTASGSASGSWRARDAGVQTYGGPTEVNGGGTTVGVISLIIAAGGYASNAVPFAFNIGDRLEVWTTIPIAAWAGSGTVQLAQNDVEYAYNTDTTTTATVQGSGFAYGPAGVALPASNWSLGTNYIRRVRFQTPIQDGDKLEIEIKSTAAGATTWIPIKEYLCAFIATASSYDYGARIVAVTNNTTDVDVYFSNGGFRPGATFGTGTGTSWSGVAVQWRVRKSSAGAAVGFGIVVPGVSSGLVSASGLPGNTTGNAIASGYVGEVITATGTYTGVTTAGTTLATIPLTSGIWSITWSGSSIYSSGSVSALEWNIALTTNASLNPSVTDYYTIPATNIGFGNITSASTIQCRGNVSQTLTLLISGNTTYNFRAALTATGGGNIALRTTATAVRIA